MHPFTLKCKMVTRGYVARGKQEEEFVQLLYMLYGRNHNTSSIKIDNRPIISEQSLYLTCFAVGKNAWGGRGGLAAGNRLANACKFDNAISVGGVRLRGEWIMARHFSRCLESRRLCILAEQLL